MRKFLSLLFVVLVAFVAVGCDRDKKPNDDNNKDTFKATKIKTVLTTAQNNSEVKVQGVVFGVVNNGFYVADGNDSRIFVLTGASPAVQVSVGDEVQISGKFNVASNFPQIRDVEITVVAEDQMADVEVEETTVEAISKLSPTDRVNSYAKLVKVEAMLSVNAAKMLTLTDQNGNYIVVAPASNVSELEKYLDKSIILTVVTHNFLVTENTWSVSFIGGQNDVVEKPYNFEDIINTALEDLNARVPKEVYGILELPTNHPVLPIIKYSWTVEENDYLSIDQNGKVTINLDTEDQEITLKVKITDGQNEETKEFKIISKAIVERSVSDLLNNLPELSMSYVHVKGLVVGIARNQSLSLRSYVIQDPETKETTTIDFSNSGRYILNNSEEFNLVNVGDMISVKAQYRSTGRPTIMNPREIAILSRNNEYTHDFEDAYVLNDLESYEYFGLNYEEFNNKLVKFENPFLNFSTSSTPADTNWVVLSPDEYTGLIGFGTQGVKRRLAFLIAAQNESLGDNTWYSLFDVGYVNEPGKQVEGSFYAYALYVSDSYIAFLIPDWSCWVFGGLTIERDIRAAIPNAVEDGTINLLKGHDLLTGNITWKSSHPGVINPMTGVVTPVQELTVVTLVAEYEYDGQTQTIEIQVSVNPSTPLTVSDLLELNPNEVNVRVRGVIAGFSHDGNNRPERFGFILLDNETGKTILTTNIPAVNSLSEYPNFYDSDGNLLAIGDEIVLDGIYYTDTGKIGSGPDQTNRHHVLLSGSSTIKRLSTNNPLNFDFENAIVIDSHEAQQAFADNLQYGVLLKFVGTEETPFYIGGSTSTAGNPLNVKIFFNKATNNDETKYNGQTFSLKSNVNAPIAGDNWMEEFFGITENFVGPTSSNPAIPIVGEMYVVVTYRTATYYQMTIVLPELATTQRLIVAE